ncbi:MAG: ATP-binding protein [Cellvibrionaceae bacterium]
MLRPVTQIDEIGLNQLLGNNHQKDSLVVNTGRFLPSKKTNNALLWGARGMGKSSLVKALLKEYFEQGLRVIEGDKNNFMSQ